MTTKDKRIAKEIWLMFDNCGYRNIAAYLLIGYADVMDEIIADMLK